MTTTLYELVAAVQDSLSAEEAAEGLAVPVVQDLLRRMVCREPTARASGAVARPILNAQDAAA
ncbi:MAG: hypothetical protein PVF51_01490 [Nitrospirota bacterium]|jgi:hypothetical protein